MTAAAPRGGGHMITAAPHGGVNMNTAAPRGGGNMSTEAPRGGGHLSTAPPQAGTAAPRGGGVSSESRASLYNKVREAISQRLMFHGREDNLQGYDEGTLAVRLTQGFTQRFAAENTFTDQMFDTLLPYVDAEVRKLNEGSGW